MYVPSLVGGGDEVLWDRAGGEDLVEQIRGTCEVMVTMSKTCAQMRTILSLILLAGQPTLLATARATVPQTCWRRHGHYT